MDIRFIVYNKDIYIVLGIGYDSRYDPPDIFRAILLRDTVYRSIISELYEINIPITEAEEITDKNKIMALWILFGR